SIRPPRFAVFRSAGKDPRTDVMHVETGSAGVAISSLCLAFTADVIAQSGTNKSATKPGTTKKAAIQPVQSEDDETPVQPPARSRVRTADRANTGEQDPSEEAEGKPARPQPMTPMRIEKVSPEIEKVLKDWELHTSQFKTLAGEFSRFRYDKTFEVEKRA